VSSAYERKANVSVLEYLVGFGLVLHCKKEPGLPQSSLVVDPQGSKIHLTVLSLCSRFSTINVSMFVHVFHITFSSDQACFLAQVQCYRRLDAHI
jgi:hypothetical protein